MATGALPSQPELVLTSSRGLLSWLAEHQVSIAFTTYQAGKLFAVGLQQDGRMSTFERTFTGRAVRGSVGRSV